MDKNAKALRARRDVALARADLRGQPTPRAFSPSHGPTSVAAKLRDPEMVAMINAAAGLKKAAATLEQEAPTVQTITQIADTSRADAYTRELSELIGRKVQERIGLAAKLAMLDAEISGLRSAADVIESVREQLHSRGILERTS